MTFRVSPPWIPQHRQQHHLARAEPELRRAEQLGERDDAQCHDEQLEFWGRPSMRPAPQGSP
jgi:hypothetical protein